MGVIAQELGTLYTLLRTQVCELYAQSRHSGALEIEGPDNLQILARTATGTAVTLQFDLLQDQQVYEYRIVSARGVIEVKLLPEAGAPALFECGRAIRRDVSACWLHFRASLHR